MSQVEPIIRNANLQEKMQLTARNGRSHLINAVNIYILTGSHCSSTS